MGGGNGTRATEEGGEVRREGDLIAMGSGQTSDGIRRQTSRRAVILQSTTLIGECWC